MKRLVAFAVVGGAALTAACQNSVNALPVVDPVAEAARKSPPIGVGIKLLAANQPEMALNAFHRSLRADGPTAAALTGAAVANVRIGRATNALRLLEAAVTVDPNSIVARNNLGVVLYDRGEYAASLSHLEHAYELTGGTDRSVADNLGIVQYALANSVSEKSEVDEANYEVIQYGHGVYRLQPKAPELTAPAPFFEKTGSPS